MGLTSRSCTQINKAVLCVQCALPTAAAHAAAAARPPPPSHRLLTSKSSSSWLPFSPPYTNTKGPTEATACRQRRVKSSLFGPPGNDCTHCPAFVSSTTVDVASSTCTWPVGGAGGSGDPACTQLPGVCHRKHRRGDAVDAVRLLALPALFTQLLLFAGSKQATVHRGQVHYPSTLDPSRARLTILPPPTAPPDIWSLLPTKMAPCW